LEAFSDGVFAVAMTLLAVDLKVPHLEGALTPGALAAALARTWPAYFAFLTSFFTVLIMWVHHHAIFRMVRGVDVRLLFSNGLLLLIVTAVPFPTAVVTEYLMTPAANAAAAFYAGFFVLVSAAFSLLRSAASRDSVLDPQASRTRIEQLRRNYLWGPPMYLLATASAWLSPWAAMGLCTTMWIFWAITTREC
jgi:uncharacterized membrane protein